ncbi:MULTISPECIES: LysR family transcriptional regulator [Brevibacillus]|uniref:LysR family transcriptional regulator, repressor for citA n=1 Tax=Brevibacillus centrosporus TaxID=54910 RepID=A0A1I3XV45_9BACL|nr:MULTISPECIES: LysR family transcriptional regulator [Brevibacillus]MDR7318250.1 LysR family transcriptional repressor of citA [Brevibacillus nitrificans]MED1795637.1 LysR family transcriptional regulator [Brevibacillus nitrificans]MED1953123.1 LysR family transcriptional regulator [Brevibacillus centrosporus]SFK23438.1 LysR family transcriptional regulator, repressor for citA [Brevibacillus centrosporus]
MDFRVLQTFMVAATTENFHQTAEALFIAQPTVSQHIRQLEKELGIELFERVGKRVRLTAAGKRYLPHAKALLEQWHHGIEDLQAWRQGYREKLNLAVSPIIARARLSHLLRRYTKLYPDVDLAIKIADSVEIGPLVQSGQADLGLTRMVPGEFQLATYLLYEDPVVFAVPSNGGDMEAPLPDWEMELQSKRLLTHNHPGYWDELLLVLRQRGLSLRTMAVSQVDITKRFIEEGLGVSFLPRTAVSRDLFENRFIELPTPGLVLPKVASYVVMPKGGVSDTAQNFVEILHSLYAPMPPVVISGRS